MGRKFKFVFIATPKGEKIGRVVAHLKLADAREARKQYRQRGYNVSKIAKTSKV